MRTIFLFFILIILIVTPNIFAATKIWNGGTGAGKDWITGTNWSGSTAPVAGDDIIFNTTGTITFSTMPGNVSYNSLAISSGNVILNKTVGGAMTLTLGGNTGTDFTLSNEASLTIGTNVNITLAANATAGIIGTLTINTGRTYNTNGTTVVTTVAGSIINSGTVTNTTASKLVFSSGSTYQHSQDAGTIPTATWNSNSTCLVTGTTTTNPTGFGQTFGHLTWNCPTQTVSATLGAIFTLNGNFTLTSTGTGVFRIASGTTTIARNYSQTGGAFRVAATSARILNVGGNFSISGGTFLMTDNTAIGTLNVAGNFLHTGGTITETSTGSGSIVFNGTSNQNYTGGGTISNTINFTVNNSAGIALLTSVIFPAGLTMTNGNIALNGNTLTLGTATANAGSLSWTNGFMVGSGSFTRWYSTAPITIGNVLGLFPMGNGTDNRSVWIGGTPSTGGTVSVQHTNATGTTALSFVENSQTFDKRTNMGWTLSGANGFAGSTLSLRIQGSGIPGINSFSDLNISLASTAAGGTYSSPGGTTSNPQVNRAGLTQATLANTFYVAATSSSPLPVELSSFSASVVGDAVKLNWRTETEVNNYGFEVERCALSAERQAWEKIGFVNGNGNSNSPKSYSYEDKNVTAGKYSYRLKQIDTDGQFEYSKTVEVDLGGVKKFELSQNYPNPFNPTTTIKFSLPEAANVKLTLFNILGQEVKTLVNESKESGVHTINFNASELNSGIYIYKLESGSFTQTRKMTLVK